MPKRKRESKEERYKRKIKRLERKLKDRQGGSRSQTSSPFSSRSPTPALTPTFLIPDECDVENEENVEIVDAEVTGAECVENTIEILDDSIIKALGQTTATEKEYGPDIHTELVKRVEGIITQGLKQDLKEELTKKYLIPANTKLLDAPRLNKELEGLLNDTMKARDKRVEDRQQQMGVAIAALLSTTDRLIKDDADKIKLISTISDVTRLLMDLHYQDTVTRKRLIIPNLDKNIGKTVENQKRDEYLFGEKFNDNVKAATAIKKSAGTILKQNTPNRKHIPNNRPNYSQNYPKKQGNFRGPPRASMTQFKQGGGGRYHQQTQHYPQQTQHYSQKSKPPQRPPAKPFVRQT